MTSASYKSERQRRGTLKSVAAQLDIHWTTLARRESSVIKLTTEMYLALCSLPLRNNPDLQQAKRNQRPNHE